MQNQGAKIVMVTGATSGIGKATAQLFAKKGYNLIITGRRTELLENLKEKIKRKYAVRVKTLEFDVRKLDEVRSAFQSLDENWGDIDILVNNAGLAKGFDFIDEGNTEDWDVMIDTNLKGLLYVTKMVTPRMKKLGKGHIINICSTAAYETYPKGNVYCATKAAVKALTRAMRLDLYQHNVRVSQVSPGHTEDTEFALVRFDGDENKAKIYEDFTPLRAKDVADAVFYVATRPKHVNIQELVLMGSQQASSNFIHRGGRLTD